jgi:hypothetical protein
MQRGMAAAVVIKECGGSEGRASAWSNKKNKKKKKTRRLAFVGRGREGGREGRERRREKRRVK